jgi:hypothetical protein
MLKVIDNYKNAIETSDENLLQGVLAPQVLVEFPAGTSDSLPASRAGYMLSQVAKTASGVKYALTADAGNDWYFLGFECRIEDQKLQGVDQLHLDKDGKIDRLIAYMRPVPVVERFDELIAQRLRPAK